MKGNARVIEYLNQALKHELTTSSQFWLHYRLLEKWGYGKMAAKWRKVSIDEMEHADDLITRIIFLEASPDLQHLNPLMIGETPGEVLDADLRTEYEARAIYRDARDHCREAGDYVSMNLFERLLDAEEGHIDFLETQIDLLDSVGAREYGILNADPADLAG